MPTVQQSRARLQDFRRWAGETTNNEAIKNQIGNGVLPEGFTLSFPDGTESAAPLTFTEITSFSTWFFLHPDKVCGKEMLTTSLHFPVTTKGNREDCEAVFRKYIPQNSQQNPTGVDTLELEAAAAVAVLEMEMLLLEI